MPSSILDRLNPEQREAASHVSGPLLIIAGAGSGKTRTLTHRIAYLLAECGVRPSQILAVTFTNKAAAEMKERIADLVGDAARSMWVGTFHSICVRLLRQYGEAIGYTKNFVIFDEDDRQSVIKQALAELDLDPQRFPPRNLTARISDWKNDLLLPDDAAAKIGERPMPPDKVALDVYRLYQERLRRQNALDFDDLIMATVHLLRHSREVREGLQARFEHVMVDEYQDINQAQYELIQSLTGPHRNVCVVGDDDQSIYGWRGARVEIILQFDDDYPDAKIVKLERNYRSTQAVLDVANALIANNRGRRPKKLKAQGGPGDRVKLHVAGNEHDEAWYIADQIQHQRKAHGRRYGDHVVLYRTNAMSRVFEQVFHTKQIPYRILGGTRFFDRKEVRDAIAYLRVMLNPIDDVSLARIINVPTRGIGQKTIDTLRDHAGMQRISLWEAVLAASDREADILATGPRAKVAEFAKLMTGLMALPGEMLPAQLVEAVIDGTGYRAALEEERTVEASGRLENLQELVSLASEPDIAASEEPLATFLEKVALQSDTDALDADADAVVLMTLHSAKGLEYPVVFFAGLEEGLLPHQRSIETAEGVEEERRLCYVGMTRAEHHLFLTRTFRRTVYGQTLMSKPSRFLAEIPSHLLDSDRAPGPEAATWGADSSEAGDRELDNMTSILSRKRRLERAQSGASTSSSRAVPVKPRTIPIAPQAPFSAGDKVKHSVFGEGIVLNCSGSEVQVAFVDQGVKRLALEYAKLEKV